MIMMTMKPKRITCGLLLAGPVAALVACSTTPPPTLISLPLPEPVVAQEAKLARVPTAPASAASTPRVLTVRRIVIPEYVQTESVRYRQADNTLVEWPNTAWAERLEVGMTSQLALRLRQQLPGWTVCDAHCPLPAKGLVLMTEIVPLDYMRAQKALRAEVHWRVMGPGSLTVPVVAGGGASDTSVDQDNAVGQAAAIAGLLKSLSAEIAKTLP